MGKGKDDSFPTQILPKQRKTRMQGVVLKGVRESDKWQKESPPVESRGSEQTPLRSKLSLTEESRCGWIYS